MRVRYQAARAGSAGPLRPPAAARPQSGAFSLELAAIEGRTGSDRLSEAGPQLVEHDLQGIMDSEPVQLPYTRAHSCIKRNARAGRPDRCLSAGRILEDELGGHQLMANQEAHQAVSSVIAGLHRRPRPAGRADEGQRQD